METIITILVLLIALIKHFHEYNLRHKLQKRVNDLKIPFDDYAHYQKAYVEFYKWLTTQGPLRTTQLRTEQFRKEALSKYEELFNQEDPKNIQYETSKDLKHQRDYLNHYNEIGIKPHRPKYTPLFLKGFTKKHFENIRAELSEPRKSQIYRLFEDFEMFIYKQNKED